MLFNKLLVLLTLTGRKQGSLSPAVGDGARICLGRSPDTLRRENMCLAGLPARGSQQLPGPLNVWGDKVMAAPSYPPANCWDGHSAQNAGEQVAVARQELIPKESTGLFRLRGLLFLEHCGPHSVWKGPRDRWGERQFETGLPVQSRPVWSTGFQGFYP